MKTVTELPHRVRRLDDVRIPLSDGVHLAARVWLPEDAEDRPVPAILEYIPYRLRDGTFNRDAYWKHGSVCEDFSDVEVPMLAVSGWADGYTNAVFRLMEGLEGPRLGLVGPWSHRYPHQGEPGPAIGFLQECVRWWDQWLKGKDTGIMEEPVLRVWMQDSMPPTTSYTVRHGRWVGETSWPSANIEPQHLVLNGSRLQPEAGTNKRREKRLTVQSPLTCGLFAGKWCSYSTGPDLAHDQREDDGGALTFDTAPLDEDLELLGAPELELELAADRPVAMIAVRLSDVAPDDKATRVTYGVLNLTHRDGHEHPAPLEPGRRYRVRVVMNSMAQVFPKSHRLRLSVSTSYWPLAWPPPQPVRLTIYDRASRLVLPKRRATREEDGRIEFGPAEGTAPEPVMQLEPPHHNWYVHRDLAADSSTLEVINDNGLVKIESLDLEKWNSSTEWYTSVADDFDSIRGETLWNRGYRRGEWEVKTVTRTVVTSDADNFHIHATLDAYEGERLVYCRTWDDTIPRSLV
ncbi:MAG: CocE/NonD family hydrolase [Gammaproteobacteria bacterium]